MKKNPNVTALIEFQKNMGMGLELDDEWHPCCALGNGNYFQMYSLDPTIAKYSPEAEEARKLLVEYQIRSQQVEGL